MPFHPLVVIHPNTTKGSRGHQRSKRRRVLRRKMPPRLALRLAAPPHRRRQAPCSCVFVRPARFPPHSYATPLPHSPSPPTPPPNAHRPPRR